MLTTPNHHFIVSCNHGISLIAETPASQLLASSVASQIEVLIKAAMRRQLAPSITDFAQQFIDIKLTESQLSEKHKSQLKSRMRRIVAILTQDASGRMISFLNQNDCTRLRAELPKLIKGQSTHQGATLAKHYQLFNSLTQSAASNGYLIAPLLIDHHYKKPATNLTRPFCDIDLQSLFEGYIYSDYRETNNNPKWDAHAFKFWITPLGLFTGMRLNEICQLEVRDIYKTEGMWVISVNDDAKQKSLKTPYSRREIPILPELIDIGFLDFVEAMRNTRGGNSRSRLFPELGYTPMHHYARQASRFFMGEGSKPGYLEQCCQLGSADNYGFKSLRRTFAHRLRDHGAPAEVIADLLGHASPEHIEVTRAHYAGMSLLAGRKAALAKYMQISIDLSQVHWAHFERIYRLHKTRLRRGTTPL